MLTTLLEKFFRPPSLKGLSLTVRTVNLSLDGLHTGVDNIRHDVHLSDGFCKSVHDLTLHLVAKHTRTDDILNLDKSSTLSTEKEQFKRLCAELMSDAINMAKLANNSKINILAQVAVIKFILKNIRGCFDILMDTGDNIVREYNVTNKRDRLDKSISLKNRLSELTQNKNAFLCSISREFFQYLAEVQTHHLNDMRRINFGEDAVLPEEIYSNPLFYAEKPSDDVFMIEEYDLLMGHRADDPDKYEPLIEFIVKLLAEIHAKDIGRDTFPDEKFGKTAREWVRYPDNVDALFNHFQTLHQARMLKKKKGDKSEIFALIRQAAEQKRRLNFFYKRFDKAGIIKRIAAMYEMKPMYSGYCPPLVPQIVLQYMTSPGARKGIRNRLERSKQFYAKSFSAESLDMAAKRAGKAGKRDKQAFLMRFLKSFFRYHRDFENSVMLRQAMDGLHLATEDRIIQLSKTNNTLYEFLLPHERVSEEKPIFKHVIIKADVRGSTDITHRMIDQGLNPASYFSLNLFDPITDILSEYDASKVFVEGDAIILSVFEREETPEGWYSVARACGLAANMLSIVQRYNVRNHEYHLPIIELGIGICFKEDKPLFLFDGNNRIMISSAINLADRLSGCSKALRKRQQLVKGHFNLYVFQTVSEEEISKTADDLFLRYNVNGIELNKAGFEKLKQEIDLRCINATVPGFGTSKMNFYVGKFPTVNGEHQTLVIREAPVLQMNPDTFGIIRTTSRNYYEVCTNPKICESIVKAAFKS